MGKKDDDGRFPRTGVADVGRNVIRLRFIFMFLFLMCFQTTAWGFIQPAAAPGTTTKTAARWGRQNVCKARSWQLFGAKKINALHLRKDGSRLGCLLSCDATDTDEKYTQWATKQGISAPKVKIGYTDDGLRGLVASQDITPPHAVVTVPRSSALYAVAGQQCPFPDWIKPRFWDGCALGMKLALLLIHEKRLGMASRFESWISAMPRSHEEKPASWSMEELEQVHDRDLVERVVKHNATVQGFFESLQRNNPDTGITRDEWCWAMHIVCSRGILGRLPVWNTGGKLSALVVQGIAVNLKNKLPLLRAALKYLPASFRRLADGVALNSEILYMPPYIDLLNHRTGVEAYHIFDDQKDAFVVMSQEKWVSGQDVRIDYKGERSNARMLLVYGFVEADSTEHMRVTLPGDSIMSAAKQIFIRHKPEAGAEDWNERLKEAHEAGLMNGTEHFEITVNGPSSECEALLTFLAPVRADDGAKNFATEACLLACESELSSLPTTFGDDMALLRHGRGTMSVPFEMALRYRVERKRLLNQACDSVSANLGRERSRW